MIKISDRKRG